MPGHIAIMYGDLAIQSAAFGLFCFAFMFYVRARRNLESRSYLSLAAFSAIAGAYTLIGSILDIAYQRDVGAPTLAWLVIAQESCLPFFMPAIVAVMASFIPNPPGLSRFNRTLSAALIAVALLPLPVSIAFPASYLHGFAIAPGGLSVHTGWLYYATRIPTGAAILYALVLLSIDFLKWKNLKDSLFFIVGSVLSAIFAVSSLWRIVSGSYLDPFGSLRFSRVLASLVVFGVIISTGFILRFLREAGETKKAKDRIHALLVTDALSGLPNRSAFARDAEEARASGKDSSFILFDIDGFLDLNESYGAETGDGILKGISPAIVPLLGPGDRLFRMGGDEFAVLTGEGAGPAYAMGLVESIRKRLREGMADDKGAKYALEISTAIARLCDFDGSGDALLSDVYSCLREAKREGNAVKVFTRAWHRTTLLKVETVRALRSDLGGEGFRVEYQPIHDSEGRLACAEALLRWDGSEAFGGPAVFIPLAESAGLMAEIGRRVLELVIADMADAMREGAIPPVSVNLSPAQLMDPLFREYLGGLVAESGVDWKAFQFEVTESMFMEKRAVAAATLQWLRNRGSAIAIDDFGSGYSNLGYLGSLPVDKIKIDKSFIASVPGNPSAESLVRSFADLGRSFGLGLLVEGIETTDQFAFMKSLGYREFQGFLFSTPLRPETYLRYARERS